MDIADDSLCEEMLQSYGADALLREKVELRRAIRPMFVIGTYVREDAAVQRCVQRIRDWLMRQ